MDAKLIQQKESEQFYVTGTFNPTTDTASLDKTNLLTKSGIDFSGSGEFALQQLILQNLAVQSTTLPIQHQEPVVSSSIQSGGSQNTYQVQSAPGAAPSSFRSDFLPFVSASSETVNTSRTQFLSENQQIQPQSASQNPILVASRESTASVGQSYSLPATEIRQPGPNTLLSSAIAPQFVLTPVQRPLLNQFLVRATVSAISQQALRASDILYSEPRIPQPVLSQPVLPKQVILPSKFPRNSEKSSSSLFFVSSMLTIPHQMPRLEPQHDVVAEQNQIRVISSILSVPAIEFPSTRSVVSVQSPAVSLSFSAPNQQEPQKPEPPKSEKPIEVKAVSFLSQISQPSQFSTEVKYAGVVFVPHVRPAPHTKVVRYMESIPVPQISAIIRTPRQKLQTESSRVSRQERKPASRKLPEAKSSGKKPRIAKKEPSPKFRRGLEDKFPRKKFRKFEPLNDAPINAKPKTLKNVVRRAEKHKTETPKSEKKKPERKMPGTPAQKSDSQKARTSENGKPEK